MATILLSLSIDADENRIYDTLTGPGSVAGWWSNHTEGPSGTGSVMKLAFPEVPMTFDFEVLEEEPCMRVVWKTIAGPPEWSDTTISFDIKSGADGNRSLLFKHDGWKSPEEPFPSIAYAWAQILPRLKRLAETGKEDPFFNF
jgi:uncharacterized protein YndB with AHSA1/START domain